VLDIVSKMTDVFENANAKIMKVVLVGESGVGKSCLLIRFSEDKFDDSHVSTIGVDFKIRNIKINDKNYKIHIWDTAGQERFRTIVSSYYRGAHGIIYIYDIDDRDSFDKLDTWVREVESQTSHMREKPVGFVLGNKIDDDKSARCVTRSEAETYAKNRGFDYVEVSAKTGHNVDNAFMTVIKTIAEKLPLDEYVPMKKTIDVNDNINVKSNTTPIVTTGCC